jgi:hypothetical protein
MAAEVLSIMAPKRHLAAFHGSASLLNTRAGKQKDWDCTDRFHRER